MCGLFSHQMNIIKKKEDFQKIYKEGKSYSDSNILLLVVKGSGRVAFAAGKKLGSAPVRNRAKRLMRECYRVNSDNASNEVDFIMIARNGIIGKKLADVLKSFEKLRKKAGI